MSQINDPTVYLTNKSWATCRVFPELQRNTEYQFRIQALNVNGSSPATQWQFSKTFMHDLDGKVSFPQDDFVQFTG